MSLNSSSAVRVLSICGLAFGLHACDIIDGEKVIPVSDAEKSAANARAEQMTQNFRAKEYAPLVAQSLDKKAGVFFNKGVGIAYSTPVTVNPAKVQYDTKCTEYDKADPKKCTVSQEYILTIDEPSFNAPSDRLFVGADVGVVCRNAFSLAKVVVEKNEGKSTGKLPDDCRLFSAQAIPYAGVYDLLATSVARKEPADEDSKKWVLSMPGMSLGGI